MRWESKKIVKQGAKFFLTSGVAWLIDFGLFTFLTVMLQVNISKAYFVSAVPAVTLVFIFSTHKIFNTKKEKVSVKIKYILYIMYQLILLVLVSHLSEIIYVYLSAIQLFQVPFLALIVKILITPITMIANFIVLKILSEKM